MIKKMPAANYAVGIFYPGRPGVVAGVLEQDDQKDDQKN
jgi:hypothetical protein